MNRKTRGFTLIELLVVIAIIAVLISILLPALASARCSANVAYCLANMRQISTTSEMYTEDEGDLTLPWHLGFNNVPWNYSFVSEFIYGGYRHEQQNPTYNNSDTFIVPTENRPFNKYIAPGAAGRSIVKTYKCPADKWSITPLVGSFDPPDPDSDVWPSWQVNGNSYAINWYWQQDPPWNGNYYIPVESMEQAGRALLSKKVGGPASRFALFTEAAMNAFMYAAEPVGGPGVSPYQTLRKGWHCKFSKYSIGFMDGHAEFLFIDTRFSNGPLYETRAEPNTPRGF